jgi:hypothetical protein
VGTPYVSWPRSPTQPDADWCWVNQVADALGTMQQLVTEAIAAGADTLAPTYWPSRSSSTAAQPRLGIRQTTARSEAVMRNTTHWSAGSSIGKTTTAAHPRLAHIL